MSKRLNRSTHALISSAAVLLIASLSSSALASNGFKSDCDEANDPLPSVAVPAPSLTIVLADHGLTDSAADMKDPAADPGNEELSSPALAEATTSKSQDNSDSETETEEDAVPVSDPPETALRLPGVSEADQPRFRRQMYRTDI